MLECKCGKWRLYQREGGVTVRELEYKIGQDQNINRKRKEKSVRNFFLKGKEKKEQWNVRI